MDRASAPKRGGSQTRDLVLKYALKGLNAAEIARVTGISRQAAAVHLRRLREDGELQEKAS